MISKLLCEIIERGLSRSCMQAALTGPHLHLNRLGQAQYHLWCGYILCWRSMVNLLLQAWTWKLFVRFWMCLVAILMLIYLAAYFIHHTRLWYVGNMRARNIPDQSGVANARYIIQVVIVR
jgi:hypothetical protein